MFKASSATIYLKFVSHAFILQTGTLLGIHGWGFSWVGSSKIVAVAIQTSPLAADATAAQFLAHLLCLSVPVDAKKLLQSPARAQGQTLPSMLARLLVTGSLVIFLFTPVLHEVAAERWSPHPTVELVVDCAFSFLSRSAIPVQCSETLLNSTTTFSVSVLPGL